MARPSAALPALGLALLALVLLVLAPVRGARARDADASGRARCLDSRASGYREDGGSGRRVAWIEARLVGGGGEARLELVTSALGPRVDPTPGFEGVRGANRIAAREQRRLAAEGRLSIATRPLDGGPERAGSYRVARTGPVPLRRLLPNGRVEALGLSEEEYPLELAWTSGALGPGAWRSEVRVDGLPRLVVDFELDADGGRIREVRSTGPLDEEQEPLP